MSPGVLASSRPDPSQPDGPLLLTGRRIVVTGVLTHRSLAYSAALAMQQQGAEIVLTGHGRTKRMTARAASTLPTAPDVIELDALEGDDFPALAAALGERWDGLDGIFHSMAYAPPSVWEHPFHEVEHAGLDVAMRASVYSLQALTGALLPLLRKSPDGASILAMTVMSGRMSPHYSWMGVVKGALDAVVRHLAVDLGPEGIRANAIACGPVRTNAATGIPGFGELEALYEQRSPLGWDSRDPSVIGPPACFLLSKHARATTGEILHVDGGYHVVL